MSNIEESATEILIQLDPCYAKCEKCEILFNVEINKEFNRFSMGYNFEEAVCIFCYRFHSMLSCNFEEQKIDKHSLESIYGHLYDVSYNKTLLMFEITKKKTCPNQPLS